MRAWANPGGPRAQTLGLLGNSPVSLEGNDVDFGFLCLQYLNPCALPLF